MGWLALGWVMGGLRWLEAGIGFEKTGDLRCASQRASWALPPQRRDLFDPLKGGVLSSSHVESLRAIARTWKRLGEERCSAVFARTCWKELSAITKGQAKEGGLGTSS